MAVKFFGQYLVEQGTITMDGLRNAVELQEKRNLKLGELAMEMGLISVADIQLAHNEQMTRDVKLGDLLVDRGLLSPAQLNDLLVRQKNNHLYIGEALIQTGALTETSLREHLESFSATQAIYAPTGTRLPITTGNDPLWEMCLDLTCSMVTRVLDLKHRPGTCMPITTIHPNHMLAAMELQGDVTARFIISVSEKLQKTIARAMLSEWSVEHEPAEILEDTVREFANVICGNIAAKASQAGVVMDILPPYTVQVPPAGLPTPDGYGSFIFPIHLEDGDTLELILLIQE